MKHKAAFVSLQHQSIKALLLEVVPFTQANICKKREYDWKSQIITSLVMRVVGITLQKKRKEKHLQRLIIITMHQHYHFS